MRILTATLLVGGSVLLAAALVTPASAQCDCEPYARTGCGPVSGGFHLKTIKKNQASHNAR